MRSADARASGGKVSTLAAVPAASAAGARNDATIGTSAAARVHARFPIAAGVLLGLGLGGFFDGIVFHQLLQWHHMATSAGYPPDSLDNLRINTLLDGLFHALTYVFVVWGLAILWRRARHGTSGWAGRALAGAIVLGFGVFNVVEGTVNHHLLGLHHVNETAPREQWMWWDVGFLAWGALMIVVGAVLIATARSRERAAARAVT